MRIALDCRCVFQGMGGIGRYAWSLLHEFLEIGSEHEFVCLFTHLPPPAALPVRSNLSVRVFEAGMIDERFDQFILPGVLEEEAIDLYHNPTFSVPSVRGRTRYVATIHDVVFSRRPELVEPRLRGYLDAATRRACRGADQLITVSEFSRSEIVAAYGVPGERLRVIHNGVHAPKRMQREDGRAALRGLGVDLARFVLYVGSIERKKNIGLLLDAFTSLRGHGDLKDVKLVLAGTSVQGDAELDAKLRSAFLSSDLVLPGHVSESTLEALYGGAEAFVYPSLYEGFGLPPLEAMLRGVPTIVSRASCLPEVVGDGALVVSPDSAGDLAAAMRQLLKDEPLRARLVEGGRRRAEQFTWRRSAEAHLATYEEILRVRG